MQHITNNRVSLPRKEQQKAAADTAKVLSGLNMQPGKLLVDIHIDFNNCKRFKQLTQQVNPDIKIESVVKIGGKCDRPCIDKPRFPENSPAR